MTGKNRHNHLFIVPGGHTEEEVDGILNEALFEASFADEPDSEISQPTGELLSPVAEIISIGEHLDAVRKIAA